VVVFQDLTGAPGWLRGDARIRIQKGDPNMPKGVQRSNREAKKPKQAKKAPPVPVSSSSPISPAAPVKKK